MTYFEDVGSVIPVDFESLPEFLEFFLRMLEHTHREDRSAVLA